jgi:hypothetical protein
MKRGGRFSRKAATPSVRAGVRAAIAWLRASRFRTSSAEGGELGRPQILIPEDQHRMLGKGRLNPGKGACVERFRQIDPEDLGSQRCAEGAKFAVSGSWPILHGRRPI